MGYIQKNVQGSWSLIALLNYANSVLVMTHFVLIYFISCSSGGCLLPYLSTFILHQNYELHLSSLYLLFLWRVIATFSTAFWRAFPTSCFFFEFLLHVFIFTVFVSTNSPANSNSPAAFHNSVLQAEYSKPAKKRHLKCDVAGFVLLNFEGICNRFDTMNHCGQASNSNFALQRTTQNTILP